MSKKVAVIMGSDSDWPVVKPLGHLPPQGGGQLHPPVR